MATLRFCLCLLLLSICLTHHENHAFASPPPFKPVSPSLSNRSPDPNTHPRAIFIPHVEIPPIEPVIPPSTPHGSTPGEPAPFAPGEPAPPKIGQDPKPTPKPTPKPDEPEKPEHPDGPDGPDSSSESPTPTYRSRFSSTWPVYFTGSPAAVIVGNTTVTAGASAVFISGHTVAFWASSVLEVDTITTTLASPNTGVTASATVIAGLTVQPVATASTDVGSGPSSPSSGAGTMFSSGASRLSVKLPTTLISLWVLRTGLAACSGNSANLPVTEPFLRPDIRKYACRV